MSEKIEVYFTHPRNAKVFTAEVSPQCTGEMAIQGLLQGSDEGPFLESPLPGRSYELAIKRTYQAIAPSMTFEQAGVLHGDVIEVRQNVQGAGSDWLDLGHMLFWSGAAASIFLKAAVPVLIEFLKNKRSRSVIVEKGELRIVITGEDPDKVKDILKVLENVPTGNDQHKNIDQNDKRLDSPISVTLHDSEKLGSAER
jgi:hypothetical protein